MDLPDRLAVRPRLCFLGPMVGRNPGFVVTQGERLSTHFEEAGYSVVASSSSPNRYRRLLEMVVTLLRMHRRIDVVIIHVYGGRSFVVEDITSWMARRLNHRLIMSLHGGAMPEFMTSFPRWSDRVLRRAHALSAPSEYLSRAVRARGFRCQVIPNVIDVGDYPYRLRRQLRPRLLWLRTFHEVYNPFMAVRVLARLRETHPDATLIMAGQDKGLQAATQRLASAMGVGAAVLFPGFLDLEGKIRAGQEADIFINTSRIDNMPVTVVEACAMGLPVVSVAVGGIRDLLRHEQTGLLVPDDDDDAMLAAIRRLLGEATLAEHLSSNARPLAERSEWDRVRLQWEHLFARVLSPESPRDGGV
jgi:glycosyltransferase involved in cell wall biosynthesis